MAKLSILLCMVAVAMTAATTAAVTTVAPVSCKTNRMSPLARDASIALERVHNMGTFPCYQDNCKGDFCTVLSEFGSSRVLYCGICQSYQCNLVAQLLERVLALCTHDFGGTARVAGEVKYGVLTLVIDTASSVTNGIGTPTDTIAMKTDDNNV